MPLDRHRPDRQVTVARVSQWFRSLAAGGLAELDLTELVLYSIRITAACALAYGFADMADLQEAYWALITAIIVTQPGFGDTIAAARNRVLGTVIGAGSGFLVLEGIRRGLPLLPLFWAALVPLALLTAYRQQLRLSCVTLIIVVLIPSPGAPYSRPLDRVFGILLGTAASIIVSALIPKRPGASP